MCFFISQWPHQWYEVIIALQTEALYKSKDYLFHTLTKVFYKDRFVVHKGELISEIDLFSVHKCWITSLCDQMRPGTYSLAYSFPYLSYKGK